MNTTRHMWAHPRLLICLGLWTALAAAKSLNAQDAPADAPRIQVLQLQHTSANEVMQVIQQVTQGSGVELAADAQSNALIIKAAPSALEEIKRIVATLDTEQGTPRSEDLPVAAHRPRAESGEHVGHGHGG